MSGKRDFLVAFIVSALLSLFVNFALLMRMYYSYTRQDELMDFAPPFERSVLYFSLIWFFLFSFILFVATFYFYGKGHQWFGKKEYKTVLFVIAGDLILSFALIQFYPPAQKLFSDYVLPVELPAERTRPERMPSYGPFGPGFREPGPEMQKPASPIPFLWPLDRRLTPRPILTEHLFVLLTIILTVALVRLLENKQKLALEFERLKAEKWQTSYNALMGQINPHFFFNSLNGLNALIRNDEKEQTLHYLDELSNVFRYILQSNRKEMITLGEELQFVKAYTYLLGVRYEGKLFFSIHADPKYLIWYLPTLSVLPLIENAVKHNVISKQYPLRIDICTDGSDQLVVSNPIQPKAEGSTGSGIGLQNLWGRYRMLTDKDIHISSRNNYFSVSLPLLIKPAQT